MWAIPSAASPPSPASWGTPTTISTASRGIPDMTAMNRQVLLASRPQGAVAPENFRIVEAPIPAPGEGEVLVRNEWLSLDPYMRGRMSDAKSYAASVEIGGLMVGQTVGEVVESRHPGFKKGDKVLTSLGWQLYGVARGKELMLVDAKRIPAS